MAYGIWKPINLYPNAGAEVIRRDMKKGWAKNLWPKVGGYVFAVFGVAVVTAALSPFHGRVSSTTVALALLLVVLFAATGWGIRPALRSEERRVGKERRSRWASYDENKRSDQG